MDALEQLRPISDSYAHLPIADAFDWTGVGQELGQGEWYLVVFRSIRRADADIVRLAWFDERAHQEAAGSPGFVHYFKGPLATDGSCLSFCIWTGRAEARAAAGRPHHAEAITLINEMYERHTLEFLRLHSLPGDRLEFGIYDLPADASAQPAPMTTFRPQPAA